MKASGRLQLHEPDQEKPSNAPERQGAEFQGDKKKNSELEKAEFLALRQSYVDHGMPFPISPAADYSPVSKSFHRKDVDPTTGKCITWVCTDREKSGNLSSIIAVRMSSQVEFGKILNFIQANFQQEGLVVESACVQLFSAPVKDRKSGLWYVDKRKFAQKTVPVSLISRPLVTAHDENECNRLWILNYRKDSF